MKKTHLTLITNQVIGDEVVVGMHFKTMEGHQVEYAYANASKIFEEELSKAPDLGLLNKFILKIEVSGDEEE